MLRLTDISKGYGGQILFKNASLLINKGEKCALVGRNGMGKTTLLRLITGEELLDGGEVIYPKGYKIGVLKQHLEVTAPTLREEAAKGLAPGKEDELYRVEKILFGLGFTEEDLDKPPTIFSGGYRIRIHLCKLLVSEPDCLLLDEPSNYLDVVSIRWLVQFLQKWRGELIMISHDRELLDSVSTHTIGVYRQGLKKVTGGTEEYFSQILQEEEIHERTRQNLEKKKQHLQSFIDRFGAKATKATQAQSRAKAIAKMPSLEKLAHLHHLDFAFRYSPISSQKIIDAQNVCFSYPGTADSSYLIDHFSSLIENGDKIAIIGKNGKGKSTLLQVLGKLLEALEGSVRLADTVRLGYFGQTHIDRLHAQHTIVEEIASANPQLNYTEVKNICGIMMFSGDISEKKISVLSGGERSRVLLGKILATPCNLLLLDEPTNHLDMESVEALVEAIELFPGTVIFVTHSEWILRRLPNKLIICKEKEQHLFLGSYDDFLEKEGWDHDLSKPVKKEKKPVSPLPATPSPKKNKIGIEKEIAQLEEKLRQSNAQVDILTAEKNFSNLHSLSREIQAIQEKLDVLYQNYVE